MSGPSYRCDACMRRTARCDACRARRAEVQRELRARKRKRGICLDCTALAEPDATRCATHQALNNELSSAAHKRARRR